MTCLAIGAATSFPKPVWFSSTTATATRGASGDHRHLERRREHALLAEGHPAGVDLRGRVRRVEQRAVAEEPARCALVGRRLERRPRVEAVFLRVGEDRPGPERLADVAED